MPDTIIDPASGQRREVSLMDMAGGRRTYFREAFEALEAAAWDVSKAPGDIVRVDGNAVGASYLVVSLDPLSGDTDTRVTSRNTFPFPAEVITGVHASQRTLGQSLVYEVVSADDPLPALPDIAISSISQSGTTLTIDTTGNHQLTAGMRFGVAGLADTRLNYPALVVASTPAPNRITATAGPGGTVASVTAGPYSGGVVYVRTTMDGARDGISVHLENGSSTNCSAYVRSASGDAVPSGTAAGAHSMACSSTASASPIGAVGVYAAQPSSEQRFLVGEDRVQLIDMPAETTAGVNTRLTRTHVLPDVSKMYRLRLRAHNERSLPRPVAKIVSVLKTGGTTATLTLDRDVGALVTTSAWVNAWGVRDQANFPNLTTAAQVVSVTGNQVQVVWGSAVTATSFGGFLALQQGGQGMQGVMSQAVQSVTRAANILTLQLSATVGGVSIGDYTNAFGLRDAATGADLGLDGPYRVRDAYATTLVLEPLEGAPTGADVALVNCGGAVIKRTDLRLSYVRALSMTRMRIDAPMRGASDAAAAVTAVIAGNPVLGNSSSAIGTVGLIAPGQVTDLTSTAITSTGSSSAITPSAGPNYVVSLFVGTVAGTSPTADWVVEESDDAGTNWTPVYAFRRITASGTYRSPVLTLRGNRIRYTRTVGGSGASFTTRIERVQMQTSQPGTRQLVDRTLAPNTAGSTTAVLNVPDAGRISLVVSVGAATTAPQLQLEGSADGGATWFPLGAPMTTVANQTTTMTVADTSADVVRARVSTAGSGATLNYVLLKGV